jgi:hypothetical protein
MKPTTVLGWGTAAIAALTILSGLVQVIVPGLLLRIFSAEVTPTSKHFFGIVGMFMFLFGGVLLHALLSPGNQSIVVLWAGLQKIGAVCAVTLGVVNHIFSPLGLLIAAFDFISAVIIIWYWVQLRGAAPGLADPLVARPDPRQRADGGVG